MSLTSTAEADADLLSQFDGDTPRGQYPRHLSAGQQALPHIALYRSRASVAVPHRTSISLLSHVP